jgi:lysophospholipase L1-like esterase
MYIYHNKMIKSFLALTFSGIVLIIISTANAQCPVDHIALTPAPLEESWAVDWWLPRHEEKLREAGRDTASLLFLGDSITQGWESSGNKIWTKNYSALGAYNLGFSGDRTENVLWRIENGEMQDLNPKLTILMIGTNNTGHRQDSPQCVAKGIQLIVDKTTHQLPETKLLILAIFPRGETPDDPLRQLNNEINEEIRKLADNQRIFFEDINQTFLDEKGILSEKIMPDFLHPNEVGYSLWAEAMSPIMLKLLESN